MLLLFDLDGTLLAGTARPLRDALYAALLEVHGVDVRGRTWAFDTAGMTDGEIARLILLDAGVPERRIDQLAAQVREICCREHVRRCPLDLSDAVLPGVRPLLERLSGEPEARLALLTGNFERIAWAKLERARIGEWFTRGQGAFGSDCEDRNRLPAIARRRAGTSDAPYPRERTVVIGDTPRDIACARADGLRCVAVATGSYTPDQLRGADAIAHSAADMPNALNELGLMEAS
jgi:phosphoglycolate phosphatase-like HAD superfamily hydrolase